jgi:hypothetical protein
VDETAVYGFAVERAAYAFPRGASRLFFVASGLMFKLK